jgi:predicted RND superfamily exporter protein
MKGISDPSLRPFGGTGAQHGTAALTKASGPREESTFDKLAAWVDETIQKPFRSIGESNGTHPRRVMLTCVFVCVMLMMGLSKMSDVTESRSDKLWFPQDTETQKDKKAYEANFPRTGGVATIIVESKESNLLTVAALTDLMTLHNSITSFDTSNGDYLSDLCVSATYVAGTTCYQQNILAAWSYDSTTLAQDSSPVDTLNSYFTANELENMLGKITLSSSGKPESAKGLKVMYFLEDNTKVVDGSYVTDENDAWELEFLSKVEKAKSSEVNFYAMATIVGRRLWRGHPW